MAAAQQGNERVLDHLLLAENHGAGGPVDALDTLSGRLNAADDGFVGLGECAHDPGLYTLRGLGYEIVSHKNGHNMNSLASVLKWMALCRMIAQ
jgi:hypothetical protein